MAFLQERSEINGKKRSLVERYDVLRDAFSEYHLNKFSVFFRVQTCIDGGFDNDLIDPGKREKIAQKW